MGRFYIEEESSSFGVRTFLLRGVNINEDEYMDKLDEKLDLWRRQGILIENEPPFRENGEWVCVAKVRNDLLKNRTIRNFGGGALD